MIHEVDISLERIKKYEKIMHDVEQMLENYSKDKALALQEQVAELEAYYTSDEWKHDYELDEAGNLPKDMKRGVLSQDGIYNLLERYNEIKEEKTMKVLIINGSPRVDGNTTVAVNEMVKVFEDEGIEVEVVQIGNKDVRGCIACGTCYKKGKCVFDDVVNELAPKFEASDGLVVASPVYYASANATLIACLDRLFYSTHFDKTMKVGASVVVARRGGLSATFDELNKYFTICGMPIASSQYWNSVHGREKGEAKQDAEGLQTMRVLARNMSFLIKSIALGKDKYGLPQKEERQATNFIR